MMLSENFSLAEMVRSQTAARKGISNVPGEQETENLRGLCSNILQPLRDHLGQPIRINSGFRCFELNAAIGGSNRSQHIEGKASDIDVPGMNPLAVAQTIIDLELPFDQLIHEFREWVHVSYDVERDRRAILTARLRDGRTEYVNGLA